MKGSLFHTLNRTLTSAGARLLSNQLVRPLKQVSIINQRLDKVDFFCSQREICDQIRSFLKDMPDIERPAMRLVIGRGTPRDLKALQLGLEQADNIRLKILCLDKTFGKNPHCQHLFKMVSKLYDFGTVIHKLKRALKDGLSALAREGDFIQPDYLNVLDEFIKLRDQSKHHIIALQCKHQEQTKIQAVKVKHNNI